MKNLSYLEIQKYSGICVFFASFTAHTVTPFLYCLLFEILSSIIDYISLRNVPASFLPPVMLASPQSHSRRHQYISVYCVWSCNFSGNFDSFSLIFILFSVVLFLASIYLFSLPPQKGSCGLYLPNRFIYLLDVSKYGKFKSIWRPKLSEFKFTRISCISRIF